MGVYVKKLEDLKKFGNPIENRQYEAQTRPSAMSMLQKTLEKSTSWLNKSTGDENYAHITDEERSICSEKLDKASAWMYGMLDKQGGLAASVDPAVTVEAIYATNKDVNNVVSPIKPKPKPKPKVDEKKQQDNGATADEQKKEEKEEAKKEEKEEAKKEETSAAEPMDTSEPMEAS